MSNLTVRVYYEDTDAGGVVYYANYLKYVERARTEYLRELGFEQINLLENYGMVFIVKSVEANYLSPAFLDDLIEVETVIEKVNHASLIFTQKIVNIDKSTVLFNAIVKVVSVFNNNLKPCALPQEILEKLNGRK
ncbi:tol-pal system-associated acyl-CoA thioesterase [Candidatus Thioglobus sp. NP1]|jgi:acyl-CoA thioester hydrolase|uniref:tol-pal system-associated acyl-CoA thioesterase n=1 Tax=Candidatus Thioglobus sp. NP1 TaxID=2508687 RepID=UPI000DEDA432|nr:tol-pal system-associated acyl-CoA thioesterase [Candidatus Thioglobus sp. NP1]AXE62474.1 tol-pal system-associated acyl-CoA thioesterase [Candidatus Thioglobus sp. NP1]|tara:strand:+ start:4781 stop:5185 length:405 start_codon:yes stop_codon:yes gene_type:complete